MAAKVKDKLTPEGKRFSEAIKQIDGMEVYIDFEAGSRGASSDMPCFAV